MLLSFADGGLSYECFDHSAFWPFNFWTHHSFLPVTFYRPSRPLFGKIEYEMFHGDFYMIYARSENEEKERYLEHVQPIMQKPQHSSINFAVPNNTSIHTRIQKWHWFTYWNYTWENRNCDANTGMRTTSFILSRDGMNIGPGHLWRCMMDWVLQIFPHVKTCVKL